MGYIWITGGSGPPLSQLPAAKRMDYEQEDRIIALTLRLTAEADEVAAEIRTLIPRQEPEIYLQLMRQYEFLQRSINTLKVRRAELEVAA